ncbi:hypothetical protein M7I_7857 [Glarea lozoyensis 74030]|uniref:Uncharacterized protein n=1 Tax=Glarea lozoyensis (strain ATCC 74030 / MF5533) TaxID=1104152 RepID=H0EYF5_GLAL7|nr:hypothetical protein M7I_7857 [Glarea lozoyensis 74030]
MPELSDVVYSRTETVQAFRDYYRFLVGLYLDESYVVEPPKGGWPSITPNVVRELIGKDEEVAGLLRELPYIRGKCLEDFPGTQATPICVWADWDDLLRIGGDGLNIMTEGTIFEDVPSHVIGLTINTDDHKKFLLDTKLGIVYWPDHGTFNLMSWVENPIEQITDDPEDYAPENEVEWRSESPAWTIVDFFELLKSQYRELNFIPINSDEVLTVKARFKPALDGMIPMIRRIYHEHGWPQGTDYRKQECLKAIKTAMDEHYPTFSSF